MHQRLFDAELALTDLARFAHVIGGLALPAGHRDAGRHALAALAADDLPAARQAADTLLTRCGLVIGSRVLRTEHSGTGESSFSMRTARHSGGFRSPSCPMES
jgi:hypothetical protein